jgi:anti-anti-sigma factor
VEKWQATQKTLNDETVLLNPGRVLDNNNAHEMVDTVTKAQEAGYKYIIVDFGELEFLSSAGVGSILGTIETSREAGGDIVLCNVRPTILHVLEVLDLVDYLTVKADAQQAAAVCGVEA